MEGWRGRGKGREEEREEEGNIDEGRKRGLLKAEKAWNPESY